MTPADLLITASDGTMVYGGTVPAISPLYTGLQAGDTEPATPPLCVTAATDTSPVGSYASSCSGAVDANYTITYADGSVSVTPATSSLTVTTSASPSVAGQPVTFTATVNGFGGGTVTGTVQFTIDGLPSGSPVTVSSAQATLSTSSLTLVGNHPVQATYSGDANVLGSPGSLSGGESITPAPAASLVVAGYPTPTVAGVSHAFTVTAKDAYGNIAPGYLGTVHFTSSDPNVAVVLPGNYTFGAGDAGTKTFSAGLATVGSQSITATDTDTASISGSQSGIMVTPGAASGVTTTISASPTSVSVDIGSSTITVQAKDQYGNNLVSSGGTVLLSATHGTLSPVTDNHNGTYTATLSDTVARADTVSGSINALAIAAGNPTVTFTPGAASGVTTTISASPTSVSVDIGSSTITVQAKDQYGNNLVSSGGTVLLSATHGTLSPVTDNHNGTYTATLSDTVARADTVSGSINALAIAAGNPTVTFTPGAASQFLVAAPLQATSGTPFTFTVTAQDQYGNTVTGYAGTVHFTSTDGDPAVVLPANSTLTNGFGTFNATLQTAGNQTLTATDTAHNSITGADIIGVAPGQFLSNVSAADADFKNIDGFDVLFGKGSVSPQLKLKNTNPGTFHYLLTLTNETGATIHDNTVLNSANGATSTVILTVPALPGSVGVTLPSSALPYTSSSTSAFWVQGSHAIHVHPDDRTDDMPVTVQYATSAPGGDCTATSVTWVPGQPADGTLVKCIKITGFSIPKHHSAKIDVMYQFAVEGTDGWASTAQTMFRAGFSFKSAATVHLDTQINGNPSGNYSSNQVAGLVGAGQQVTAVGGFVYDRNGNGVPGATIRLFNSASVASCATTNTNVVAQDVTTPDGFYFIWAAGLIQSGSTNSLPSGSQYYVMVCNLTLPQPNWPARSMDHKLGNKEFDEEDFYVSSSTALSFTQQPTGTRAGQPMGTVKVAVVDYFGNIVTGDNATPVMLTIGSGTSGATLAGTTTRTAVGGVATFTGLSINLVGSGYSLIASSPPLVGTTSGSFNITK